MVGKANRLPTTADNQVRNNRNERDLFALTRSRVTTKTVQPPPKTGVGAGSNLGGDPGNFLRTQGDTMIGPIAFAPATVFIDNATDPTNPSIDIGPQSDNPPDYSTYVYVSGSGTDDKLSTIFGAAFAGQLLKLQAIVDIEFTDAETETFGNIITNTSSSIFVPAGSITEFLFDVTSGPNGVEGAWRLASTGNANTGEAASSILGLSVTQNPNQVAISTYVIPWDDNFIFGNVDKIIATATLGVFQISDDLFNLDAIIQVEGTTVGSGSDFVVTWQSADAEGGPWTNIPTPQARAAAIEIGKASISTQPHSIALIDASGTIKFVRTAISIEEGTLVNVFAPTSVATIDTGGSSGSGGGGGSTTLAGLDDVSLNDLMVNDVLTYNGLIWINQSSASGGMNTNLSNMIDPTVPTVPLKMNLQDILGVKNLDFDDASSNIQGLKTINFFDSLNIIQSSANGLRYQVPAGGEHLFQGTNGDIAKFIEINPTDHRLDMQSNRINNIDKVLFSPVSNIDSSSFSQIYEGTDTHIHYVTKGGPSPSHKFFENGDPSPLFTITPFGGSTGGFLQDIAALKMNVFETIATNADGEFQTVFQSGSSGPADVFIHSGGVQRNVSDIGSGGAGNSISQLDSNVTVTDTGTDGAITSTIDGALITTLNDAQYSINVPVFFTSNSLTGLGNTVSGGNHSFNFGGATLFWNNIYTDTVVFENTGNFINGNSAGIHHTVGASDIHEWLTDSTIRMQLSSSALSLVNGVSVDMGGSRITSLGTPTLSADAATKQYVDDQAGGSVAGIQDSELTTTQNTGVFDHQIWLSHAKQGDKDQNQSSTIFANTPQEAIYFYPFYIGKRARISEIGVEIGTLNVNDMSVAVYDNTVGQNYPRNRISSSFNEFINTTGIFGITVNQDVEPGLYWLATWFDNGSVSTARGIAAQSCNAVGWATANDTDGALTPIIAYVESGVTASTLPATADNEMSVYALNVIPQAFALLITNPS